MSPYYQLPYKQFTGDLALEKKNKVALFTGPFVI